MNPSDEFLAITEQELRFARDLIARIESGSLVPVGLDRERAVTLLAEVAAERGRLLERLEPYAPDGGKIWTGVPV